jgi:hypothetical protein
MLTSMVYDASALCTQEVIYLPCVDMYKVNRYTKVLALLTVNVRLDLIKIRLGEYCLQTTGNKSFLIWWIVGNIAS